MTRINDIIAELGELDQHNIGSWPQWAHVGALVVVALIILGAGSWYFVLPQQDHLTHARHQEQTLKQEFKQQHALVASLGEYEAQLHTMRLQLGTLLDQLPTKSEIPDLLNDISGIRRASGLQEQIFKPEAPVNKDFYVVLPNTMTVTGKYHDLARFVSRVASLPRIVTIHDISITPVSNAADGQLTMSMTISTYRYDGDEAQAS